MPYGECKIYFDGSHYIGIPHTTRPSRRREKPPEEPKKVLEVDYIAECEKHLSRHLGRGVKITNGKRKGHLDLEFYGPDDLQQLLDALEGLQRKEATT